MYFNKLNKKGADIALHFAKENGLNGKVTTEYAANGVKFAFFKLSVAATGDSAEIVAKQLRNAGFEPDYCMGYNGGHIEGGFIGKAFSVKATEYQKQQSQN